MGISNQCQAMLEVYVMLALNLPCVVDHAGDI